MGNIYHKIKGVLSLQDPTNKKKSNINNHINENDLLKNIKSKYILKQILNNLDMVRLLKLVKYNKKIQGKLDIDINNYQEFGEIEIEMVPIPIYKREEYGNKYINIPEKDRKYYHIYFDNDIKITEDNYIYKIDKINVIKVKIDRQIKSFYELFDDCDGIEELSFTKFVRNNITNMKAMFEQASSLKKIDLSLCKTNRVTDMSYMLCGCSKLEEVNLSNFNTSKVTNMCGMFSGCTSLDKLKLSHFNTINVTNMNGMFYRCLSLNELDISNFKTNNVKSMINMFLKCKSLRDLKLLKFNIDNVINMKSMLNECPDELKEKIKKICHNIKDEAFN